MELATASARVLVVEDDEAIADVLRRSLRAEGHEVRSAGDGAEALTAAEQFAPDLVVLDLGLPRLDGMEVCRRLRAESDMPILMLTARTETEDRVRGLDSGADDYLPKPFEREELLARIRALLRRRPPRGSASIVRSARQPRHPRGQAGRPGDRADQPRVRAARVPRPQPEAGRLA
jgi:DNA-binding response OmpR family regulator